jgi:microcystin-dependent protein
MAEPFLSEIRIFGFGFAPKGWALCNGQLLPINQNQALFALLGTTYGGNGQTNFALPDFRDRVPVHTGSGHTLGERAGEQAHTLTVGELPAHSHQLAATSATGDTPLPGGNILADSPSQPYAAAGSLTSLHPNSVVPVGGSQAHPNMQPFLGLNLCIALQGIFPSQS